jgi:hypothetical protein
MFVESLSKLAGNVLGLCEVGAFKAQMLNLELLFNRITAVQFSTSAPILQNPC